MTPTTKESTDNTSCSVFNCKNTARKAKKKGKKAAFNHYKSWRKADPILNTPKYLIKRLNAYRKHLIKNRTPEQYVLNGSTWFNGRFDDVLDVDKIQAKHGGFDKRLFENKDVNTDDLPF